MTLDPNVVGEVDDAVRTYRLAPRDMAEPLERPLLPTLLHAATEVLCGRCGALLATGNRPCPNALTSGYFPTVLQLVLIGQLSCGVCGCRFDGTLTTGQPQQAVIPAECRIEHPTAG